MSRHLRRPRSTDPTALVWTQRELPIPDVGRRQAHVAIAANGVERFVVWRLSSRHGWAVARSPITQLELRSFRWLEAGLATLGDAKLVAQLCAVGRADVLHVHTVQAEVVDDESAEGWDAGFDSGWSGRWGCSCGEGGRGYENVGAAEFAARDHWRAALRAAIDEAARQRRAA
jgi:hypothetical protein